MNISLACIVRNPPSIVIVASVRRSYQRRARVAAEADDDRHPMDEADRRCGGRGARVPRRPAACAATHL
jgi:hypothetical protein